MPEASPMINAWGQVADDDSGNAVKNCSVGVKVPFRSRKNQICACDLRSSGLIMQFVSCFAQFSADDTALIIACAAWL